MTTPVGMDFVKAGLGSGQIITNGDVASQLAQAEWDYRVLKPYIDLKTGMPFVNQVVGKNKDGSFILKARPTANAATLRKDEWIQYDQTVVQIAQERLVGAADLISRGLTYNITNGMGKTVLQYEDVSDMTPAQLDMDGLAEAERDRIVYDLKSLPLPIIHKEFTLSARVLAASRNTGDALDTSNAAAASRVVSERVEEILFNGASSYNFGGGTLYGYTDFPSRNTITSGTGAWDVSGKTGAQMLADVLAMKQASIDANMHGPWVIYIPTEYETVLDDDFKDDTDKPLRQRLLEVSGVQDIKVADKLDDGNVLMVQMSVDTVRMVMGLPITTIQWDTRGGLRHNFKVMTIMVPQLRADQYGQCGIVHLTFS